MKRIIILFMVLFITVQIFAVTNIKNIIVERDRYLLLNDNPALRAYDKAAYLFFPLISMDFTLTNTLINYRDLDIFYEDHYITQKDKKLLTRDDLKIFFNYHTPILKMGFGNFGVDFSIFSGIKSTILEKDFTKLILYGNDKDDYSLHNGKGSILYGFSKMKLYYSYPKPIKLEFIPTVNTKYTFLNQTVDYLKNLPLYFGGNLNFYFPIIYGEVLNAEQNFGTNIQESYANYKMDLLYTDVTNPKYKKKLTAGLGLAMVADLDRGYFYMDLDDIFGGIKFDNLSEKIFQGTFEDSLTHFDNAYETVNNDTIIKKTKNRYKSLSSSFTIGAEYEIYKGLIGMGEYKTSKYKYPNGFSVGIRKTILGFLPLGFKIGRDNIMNYQFISGLYLTNLELYVKLTTYGGFFNYANGTGIQFLWIQRFW